MSGGKSNNQSSTDPRLTGAQASQVEAQNKFFTDTLAPTYNTAVKSATDVYNKGLPGVAAASQRVAGVADQAATSLGETGESALRSGISGLQSLFQPDYEKTQIMNALQPAQNQYMMNIANQNAVFGGSGNLGSSRQALADRQMAGSNQALMAKIASDKQAEIAAQRLQAGTTLANLGQSGLGQSVGAAQSKLGASTAEQDLFNKYASVIFGTPSASYSLGPTGSSTSSSGSNIGFKI